MTEVDAVRDPGALLGVPADETYDVIIIGAGLTGLHQLHELRQRGRNVRLFEAGDGVGGTWYWNRYPGARLDSESYSYAYSFSEELLQEWDWTERFASQTDLERYFNHVADKFGLREDIQFGARVASLTWLEDENQWFAEFIDGRTVRSTYVITAIGILSAPIWPDLTGLDDYRGEWYHTALWPDEEIDFTDKRVAVIGTGASGIQIITEIAKTARSLAVYQRSPNWIVPLRNAPIDEAEQLELKAHYNEFFDKLRQTTSGFVHNPEKRSTFDVPEAERLARWEHLWQEPGFAKVYSVYQDISRDRAANALYAAWVSDRIRERVTDPAVAAQLIPEHDPIAVKRVPCESGYLEVFNQPNVDLISLRTTPIERYTATGIRTDDGAEREFDMIVFATGFDAFTGAFDRIQITGNAGETLKHKWRNGPITYLGLQIADFPNLFTEVAPHNKGGQCNIPRCSEQNVEWVTATLDYLASNGLDRMEATHEAEEAWLQHVHEGVSQTLLPDVDSYIWGSNVVGKPRAFVGYIGALPDFRDRCNRIAAEGYPGFTLTRAAERAPAS
ncbi:NAD(P)/FAD-dependent oxidoreductase [Jatrophihabitans sp.]|uniref:flavin-containing monooxygenase n=1 Tax=Jatrophihabitans sp. TaxID=1932789 RepID=UPI0030C75E38|nr:cyclohexanone monooxygenase [Jatrophihabitans sp.]